MTTRILLSTTSYQDTPGPHHALLESQGFEIVRERGPLPEKAMLELAGEFDAFLCGDDAITLRTTAFGARVEVIHNSMATTVSLATALATARLQKAAETLVSGRLRTSDAPTPAPAPWWRSPTRPGPPAGPS
jgi:hypothetical protein